MEIAITVSKKQSKNTDDFTTIQAGIAYLMKQPKKSKKILFIEEGVYFENIESRLSNFSMIGHGKVEIISNRYAKQRLGNGEARGTFRTSTVFVEGTAITLENLSISNIAGHGEKVGQAIALFNMGHQTIVKNCRLSGHQDTLCTGPLPSMQKDGTPFITPAYYSRHFCQQVYENCWIEGTVDFIFGGAQADFIHCQIHSRQSKNFGYITAASTPLNQAKGYHFKSCMITADNQTAPVYLGRPWRSFAQVIFENCQIAEHIHPSGWNNWQKKENERSVCFVERKNQYQGTVNRPPWITIEMR
ncbi:pectinesterase family protein [Enterococcus ratti]|uniref:Pectinesterase n=1 Tax=Enterococcus ratti TaxID=150033 RepID=A0A1L8WQU1_9ENTE|nr:pectinesterase family protein [Enterococcus ratti]OJG83387.1 hypothetical protein RV14_GL001745 [Enterococcus ratti]